MYKSWRVARLGNGNGEREKVDEARGEKGRGKRQGRKGGAAKGERRMEK